MPERVTSDLFSLQVQGTRVVYWDRGHGPVLVLIHGMFGDHLDWEPVLAPLAARHRVLAVDLPGFGDSGKPDREYTVEFFVAALSDLLRGLGIERATLVGNSFGGVLAILYALAHAEAVERLVLVSSGGLRPVDEEEKESYRRRLGEEALRALTPEAHRRMFAPIFGPPWRTAQERYYAKQDAKLERADYPAYCRALVRNIELALSTCLLDRLPAVCCPTLLLWGDRDIVIPVELARQALERLKRGELKILPGCGHVPHLDDPEAFVQAVESFLHRGAR